MKTTKILNGCRADLRAEIERGRPILVVGRNSSPGNTNGHRLAAQDATESVGGLFAAGVVDARDLAPSEAELIAMLGHPLWVEKYDKHEWRYVLWSSPDGLLRILLCAGSGTVSDRKGESPFMRTLRNEMLELDASLVWGKDFLRIGRHAGGHTTLNAAMQSAGEAGSRTFIGTNDRGVLRPEDVDIEQFLAGRMGNEQAKLFSANAQAAMDHRTERHMIDGRLRVALPRLMPVGLGQVHAAVAGNQGRTLVYLDGHPYRPAQNEVIGRLPRPLTVDGLEADQLANVAYALRGIADGERALSLYDGLADRGFSSVAWRLKTMNPDVTLRDLPNHRSQKRALSLLRRVAANIELYEQGILVTRLSHVTVEISGIRPAGGWIPSDVAEAVREWSRHTEDRGSARRNSVFGGLAVRLDGAPGKLYARHRDDT